MYELSRPSDGQHYDQAGLKNNKELQGENNICDCPIFCTHSYEVLVDNPLKCQEGRIVTAFEPKL